MEKPDLRGVPETMLQTLYARAEESAKEKHCIYDEKAVEIVSRMDYDFSRAGADKMMSRGVIARTVVLDRLTEEFLTARPGAVVVNLACGLDTRCCRMKGKYARWYNLDLPETMAVRRRFLTEEGPVYQLACSAMDESWAEAVEQKDEPVLVIIEGLTMYLSEEDVKTIFSVIRRRFAGATVLCEVMGPWVVKHIQEKSIEGSQAKFRWGISGGKAMEALLPGFRSLRDVSLAEGMAEFMPVYRLLRHIGPVRNISNKILVLEEG